MNTGLRRGRLRGMRALRPAAGAVMAAALAGQAGGADVESVYDPDVHTTGPGFNIALSVGTGDTLTIYTGTSSAAPYYQLNGGSQYDGEKVTNPNNTVQMAVFCFNSIHIDNPDAINVTGDLGLVLGSRGNFMFANASLSVGGGDGGNGSPGPGGPGAEGGARLSYGSNPPGGTAGNGGLGNRVNGVGHGAGKGYEGSGTRGGRGAGAGYGGNGDTGEGFTNGGTPHYGVMYGDALLKDLYGGSGGGAGYFSVNRGGGGGGGAVEFVALGRLDFNGSVLANGGNGYKTTGGSGPNQGAGGGGSGGGVLLTGNTVTIGPTAAINARGGTGWSATVGEGAGGRVAIYSAKAWTKAQADWIQTDGDASNDGLDDGNYEVNGLTFNNGATVDVRGGSNNSGVGSFHLVSVPPPAGTLIGIR